MRKKAMRKYACLAGVCILFLLIAANAARKGRKRTEQALVQSGLLFDTVISVSLYDSRSQEIMDGAFALCRKYELMFSPSREDSELFRMNHRGAGETEWRGSGELRELLRTGLAYSARTGGAFDITVRPLAELWDFRTGEARIPEREALKEALRGVDFRRVRVEEERIVFADDQVQIDTGAIAKGFIADRLKEYLLSEGVKSAIINLGGNVLCVGERPDGEGFQVAIRKPEKGSSEVIKLLSVRDLSVVSSGIYERCFELDGALYHHILNPRTGMPYQNGLSEVTILGPSSCICDALSTACFSLGEREGLKLLNETEGYFGYFVRTDGVIVPSEGAPE